MKCGKCGSSEIGARVSPYGGKEWFCRVCDTPVSVDQGAPSAAARRQDEPPRSVDDSPRAEAAPRRAQRTTAQPQDAPENPVPAMRRRLRWLDSEIRRLRKLERERESLSRILSAASGKPVAVVRELPKRSHG